MGIGTEDATLEAIDNVPVLGPTRGTHDTSRGDSNVTTNVSTSEGTMPGDTRVPEPNMTLDLNMASQVPGMLPPAVGFDQRYDWLPQWNTEINLDSQWMTEFAADQLNVDWFAPPINNIPRESDQSIMGVSQQTNPVPSAVHFQPTPVAEPHIRPLDIQTRWHTFVDDTVSDHDPPDFSKERFEVDETCHRTLADKLRQRVQDGPIPSTAFLVSSILNLLSLILYSYPNRTWLYRPTLPIFIPSSPSSMLPRSGPTVATVYCFSPSVQSEVFTSGQLAPYPTVSVFSRGFIKHCCLQ